MLVDEPSASYKSAWGNKQTDRSMRVPTITTEQLEAVIRRHFNSAHVEFETINPDYGSWRMKVKTPRGDLEFIWAPLTGLGVSDFSIENDNPFAPCDFPLESLETVDAYLTAYLQHKPWPPAL